MNITRNDTKTLINIDIVSILMFCMSLVLLSTLVLEGSFAPIFLYALMIIIGTLLITLFSNKDEIFFKIKLFVFFFSLYLTYALINSYILLSNNPNILPYDYVDEITFYTYSNLGLPYISGEIFFLEMFSNWKLAFRDVSLHVFFSSLIAYISISIDGVNNIMAQKLLSPFFGGMFSIVLYSTLKQQFENCTFVLNATFAYGLLSAVFIYSIPLLRDIDIALAYMIFIYLFLQPNSYKNFFLLLAVSFLTIYLRTESGMVLFGSTLLYAYLYIRKLESKSIKLIFYILLMVLFSVVFLVMYSKIIGMIVGRNEVNLERGTLQASTSSIGVLLNKLPFPLNSTAKLLFGLIQPFPFFMSIERLQAAISGVFWPFILIMMSYAVMKKNIRVLIATKVKYLLVVAIVVLFLMSSEPSTRRMMSLYPIIYIVSLYAFLYIPKNEIKRIFFYYIFGIISINTFYYLIKL